MISKVIDILLILSVVNAFVMLVFILDGYFDLLMSYEYLVKLIVSDIIIGVATIYYVSIK